MTLDFVIRNVPRAGISCDAIINIAYESKTSQHIDVMHTVDLKTKKNFEKQIATR